MTSSRPLLPLVLADVPSSLRRILSQTGVPCVDFAIAPTAGRFVLFDGRRAVRPLLAEGQEAMNVDELRCEFAADPFSQLDDTTTARTWWRVGPWTAAEETARLDKASLRTAVLTRLRQNLAARGGVWMQIAPVPYPYRTAFNFRFDHDEFVAEDFDAVTAAIAGHEAATTHFVCAATHERHAAALRRLAECDVGSHGYRHHTYATFAENRLNIARGIESLRRMGFEPSGFAAPHGRNPAALAAATASLGITHSSEFAAAYDDLPFFPTGGVVLQIPIHPVCLGIVLEAADRIAPHDATLHTAAADAMAEYFVATAAAKRSAGELIFLYGHPDGRLGRHPYVLRQLLTAAAAWPDVWKTSLSEFQRWWRARSTATFSVHESSSGYEVRAAAVPHGFACGVQWITEAGVTSFALEAAPRPLSWENTTFVPQSAVELPRPVRTELPHGWKERIRRALDWEYVTPVEEIDVSRWQGRLKRSLRRWKARAA